MPIKSPVMRNIASHEIDRLLPELDPDTRREFVTAVVRQWLTNDGHAGIFTVPVNYWLKLVEQDGEIEVGVADSNSDLPDALRRWGIDKYQLPVTLRQLTLAQNATFVNAKGLTVMVRAVPKENRFEYEKLEDVEEA